MVRKNVYPRIYGETQVIFNHENSISIIWQSNVVTSFGLLRCSTKTGYLYKLGIPLDKKQTTQLNPGEVVLLWLTTELEEMFITVYLNNFFNSPIFLDKLFGNSICAIGTVHANKSQILKIPGDKKMTRDDREFLYSVNAMVERKWNFHHVLGL